MGRRKDFIPKHRQIFETLAGRIRGRVYKYGEKLPPKDELCREFAVSAITIKTAMRHLQNEKMVRSIRGTGTFVIWQREFDYKAFTTKITSPKKHEIVHSLLSPTSTYEFLMYQLADVFMQNNPHIRIRFVNIFPKDAEDPYLQRIENGDLPSCGEFFWHAIYAWKNALYPLDELPDFKRLKEKLYPQAVYPTLDAENNLRTHALYIYLGIPSFLIYNTVAFENRGFKVPDHQPSWTTIFQNIQNISLKNQDPMFFASALALPRSYHNVKFYAELMGQDIFEKNYNPNDEKFIGKIFNSESALIGLELLRKLCDSGKILYRQPHEFFAMNHVGLMPFASSWTLTLLDTLNQNMKYSVFPLPPVGRNLRYRSFLSGYSVGIFRKKISSEAQLMATWEWLSFLFHQRSQYLMSQLQKLPARKSICSYIQEQRPFTNNLIQHLLANSIPQPDFIGLRKVFTSVGQCITLFLQEKQSPEHCFKKIKEMLSRMNGI